MSNIYRYTLKIDNNTYILDSLINSANTSIKTPLCSTEFKSASGSISINLIGARDTNYYSTVMQAILDARDNNNVFDTELTVAEIDADTSAVIQYLFRGYLDNNSFTLSTKILPNNVTLTARDKTTLLDNKIRFNRVYEGKTRKYILEKLLEDLTTDTGITASLLSYPSYLDSNDYKISNWCVAEDDGNTYRERIDTLLYEAPGCVLYYDHNSDGYKVVQLPIDIISNYSSSNTYKLGDLCKHNNILYSCIIAIPTGHAWRSSEWTEVRSVNYLAKSSSLQTSAGVYKYDGLLLKYPTIETRQNQNLYAENINVSVDDGEIKGLDVVDDGYFPENGDVTATYQAYSDEGLDRAYITKESRKKNEDISLLYAKDCEYAISQHPEGACTLVTTELPNIGWTGQAQYYPKKAWVLLQNTSGEEATITGFSVQGTAVYKSKLNKLTVPSACSNPEEYETETIFEDTANSDAKAKAFAQWMFNAKKYSSTTSSWEETEVREATLSKIGDIVNVIHKETGVAIPHVVVQVDASGLSQYGTTRKYKVTAVSISGYTTYVSKKHANIPSIGKPNNANRVLITSREFALSSSSVVAPTTGWTSNRASITPTVASPYIWIRESITYGDGSIQTSQPYVGEVYTTSEVLDYSLSVSPANVIKDLRKTGTQSILLGANVSGYNSYILNYKFGGQWVADTFVKANAQITGETYYTFAQTSDQAPQTGKTYYTSSGSGDDTVYTECVNITAFTQSVRYYEKTTVQYTTGVYRQELYAHVYSVAINVPFVNTYSNNVEVELYNGTTLMDRTKLSLLDQTEYVKCAGVMQTGTTAFPTSISGENVVTGDFVVFAVNCTIDGIVRTAGSVWYINNNGLWTETTTQEKTAEKLVALQELTEAGVNLKALNETSVIQWFSEIVASSINAEYIGSQEIKVLNGGAIYGGDYVKDVATGEIIPDPNVQEEYRTGFYINSQGKLQAINAEFRRLTVSVDSTIKGRLLCGNDGDIMIETVFSDGAQKTYSATHTSTADGFYWPEAYNYITARVSTPSATQWSIVGSDETTIQDITVKSATGTVNNTTVDHVAYVQTPIATNRIYAVNHVSTSSGCANKTTGFKNCMPIPITVHYQYHRGYANWFSVVDWGTSYSPAYYSIIHTDGSEPTRVDLCYSATEGSPSSEKETEFVDDITLLAGETLTWTYGYIGSPSVKWNNGVSASVLEMTWSLGLTTGLSFYNNGVKSVMPSTGFCDLTQNNFVGLENLVIDGTAIISLPRTSSAWNYTNVNKYWKYVHSFGGTSTEIVTSVYSRFNSCSSIYIVDQNGGIHGTTTPTLSLLNTISVANGEFAFSYNGVSYSQIAGNNAWVRDYNVNIVVPSVIKGVYTASLFPRANETEDIGGTNNQRYRSIHVVTANADILNAPAIHTQSIGDGEVETSTLIPKTSTDKLGSSTNQYAEVRAVELYDNNARVFTTSQIVLSSTYNLTALSIGQIGIFAGTPNVYPYSSGESQSYRARVYMPSGGTYAYSFIMVGSYDSFRYSGYSSSVAGGSEVTVSNGSAIANSGNTRIEMKYWRVS